MAPFKVTDSSGDFALDVRLDPKTKAITQIVVTWVGPKAERRYLSVGDLLVSIDDKPVKGLLLDDVVGLEGRRMKAGDQQKLVFTDPGSKKGSTKTLTWISRGLRPAAIVKPPDSSANR